MINLKSFLESTSKASSFKAELSERGGYLTYSNSGRRGGIKYFQIGLDNLIQTLRDILLHIDIFEQISKYDETSWRDNGSKYFTDPVSSACSTVQTKPLFSTLSKVIIWSNQPELDELDPDEEMVITQESLTKAIDQLEKEANTFIPTKSTQRLLNPTTDLQIVFYGAPGTGKSYTINDATKGHSVIRTTFHPDTDYSSFVGAYKPTTKEVILRDLSGHKVVEDGISLTEEKIVYEFVSQSFLKAYIQAWQLYAKANNLEHLEKQYLIIEEINRGNCAQIFGDLFQLLDRNQSGFSDYPIEADADMQKQLRKQFDGLDIPLRDNINALYDKNNPDIVSDVLSGKILLLPNNFFIWATMNTSDQSLFPIDSAFKRRWDWEYMPITNANKGWTINVNNNKYDWWMFLEAINKLIGSTTYSEDKKLGYFFCKAQDNIISVEKFVGKVIFYLWNDVFKDYGFDATAFTDTDEGGKLTFDKFYVSDEYRRNHINERKVEIFLTNLGLKPLDEVVDEIVDLVNDDVDFSEIENSTNVSTANREKYSVNGLGKYGKCRVPFEAVKKFTELNPNLSALEIATKWTSLNIKHLPHFVETESEFNERRSNTSDSKFDDKVKKLTLNNGESIYISNQFNPERINDLITKLDSTEWNVHIIPIAE